MLEGCQEAAKVGVDLDGESTDVCRDVHAESGSIIVLKLIDWEF